MPDGATRLVSLHDDDARPIRKGRLGKQVESGYKGQVVDNEDGAVVDHNIEIGNPADAPMLPKAIERVKQRTGKTPKAVTADRGYGEVGIDNKRVELGVKKVVFLRKGKPNAERGAEQKQRLLPKLVKWRSGSEARINCLKRDFGWARTRIGGVKGQEPDVETGCSTTTW